MGPGVKATVPGTLEGKSLVQVHEQPQGRVGGPDTLVLNPERYQATLSRLLPSHGSLLS